MDQYKKLENIVSVRLFDPELEACLKVIRHARINKTFKKYENLSHFIRCAVMRLVREEMTVLEPKIGRPRKI